MADFGCIAAAGASITRLLQADFSEEQPITGTATRVVLVRSDDLHPDQGHSLLAPPTLSVYLYRAEYDKTRRAASTAQQRGSAVLPLDLHYLLTAWAESAESEQRILGKAMLCLEMRSVLTGPLLDPSGNWRPDESVHLNLEDVAAADLINVFTHLPTFYRLSVPYVAHVRMDSAPMPPVPVVATRNQLPAENR